MRCTAGRLFGILAPARNTVLSQAFGNCAAGRWNSYAGPPPATTGKRSGHLVLYCAVVLSAMR
jgi:hypothetical protein